MKVLLFLAKGFETMEASVFIDVFGWASKSYNYDVEVVTCGVNETVVSAFGVPVKVDVLLNDVNTDDIYVSFAAKTWQMIRNCKTICRQRVGICLATNLFW